MGLGLEKAASADLGDGAPDIEITAEMIEAGVCALTSELGGIDFCNWDDLARSVFLAMRNPRGSEPYLSSPRNRGASRRA